MKELFNNIFKNRKILITGHTGFKGSWLTLWLKELGAEIAGYSLEPATDPGMFSELSLEKDIYHIISDIRDSNSLNRVFDNFKPEFVFHLAAQPIVRLSYRDPRYTYETNVMGTVNLLEAVRLSGSVKAAVIITSDKCYENREWIHGYRENDPMGGYDPYSSSKGCSELVTSSYLNSYFNRDSYGKTHNVALSSARAGNVIGGGDWSEDRLIPDCVRAISKKKTIIIRSPRSIRPWQHVLEPIYGYLLLASRMYSEGVRYAGAWNFGPDDSDILTVEEVVKCVINSWNAGSYEIKEDSKLHEANLLKLDISKARFKLNWQPQYNAGEAIDKTIGWYRAFYNPEIRKDIYNFTVDQIIEYTELVYEKQINKKGDRL